MTNAPPALDLTPTQRRAVDAVCEWHRGASRARQEVFRMFGYAGTGKTSLAQAIVSELGLDPSEVVYAAFTGKACHVLRGKGCAGAQTVHSLIYTPMDRTRQRLELAERKRALEAERARMAARDYEKARREILEEEKSLSSPAWVLNTASRLREAKLCVIDEVSMINETMARDLLSFDVPVLVLGDPAQLPPVRGTGWFMNAEPDVLLTEIHRSEAGSAVTKVATAVRRSTDADLGVRGMVEGDEGPPSGRWGHNLSVKQALRFDQVLCWRNDTRWSLIRRMRKVQGRTSELPEPGERIIVLSNDRELGVYNGQEITVSAVDGDAGADIVTVTGECDGAEITIPVFSQGFAGRKGQEAAETRVRNTRGHAPAAAATFAAAITVHKAQGSQWDKVLVVDESDGVRYVSGDEQARQWGYTAVTRAAKQVVLAPQVW